MARRCQEARKGFAPLREDRQMHDNEIARQVVDVAYKIRVQFGPGWLESAYEAMLAHELRTLGCMSPNSSLFPSSTKA